MHTLYGTELSYYTGKVRAYLDWKGLPYREVAASRDVFKTTLLPNVGRAIIPVLETPEGRFIQDSADIIAALEAQHPDPSVWPAGAVQQLVSPVLDCYQQLDGSARQQADELLDAVGGSDLQTFRLSRRLARSDNQLVLADE